jgi:hypothetical protein
MAPRRSRRGCAVAVVSVLLAGLLTLVVGAVLFYEEVFKPREYLKGWGAEMGVPPSVYSVTVDHITGHRYELKFFATCDSECDEDVMGKTAAWAPQHGFPITEQELEACFQTGCIRYSTHEGHKMRMWIEPVAHSRYQLSITLYY